MNDDRIYIFFDPCWCLIRWWQWPLLWFLPTKRVIDLAEECEIHYKVWRGRIYVIGIYEAPGRVSENP